MLGSLCLAQFWQDMDKDILINMRISIQYELTLAQQQKEEKHEDFYWISSQEKISGGQTSKNKKGFFHHFKETYFQ